MISVWLDTNSYSIVNVGYCLVKHLFGFDEMMWIDQTNRVKYWNRPWLSLEKDIFSRGEPAI